VHENRIYSLKIHCGDGYPDLPPTIQFISRVNLPFVSQTDGKVDPTKLPVLANWNRNNSIETVLVEIRRFVPSLPPPSTVNPPCSLILFMI
jgi:ubiquitin-conjugating enzyme E2 variant